MKLHYSRADHSVPVPQHATAAPRAAGAEPPPPPPLPPPCRQAVLSFWLSLSSVLIWPLGFIPGILFGRKAKAKIEQNPELRGQGLAKAGLAMGYGFALIFCVAAVGFAVRFFKGIAVDGKPNLVTVRTNTPVQQPDTNQMTVLRPVLEDLDWTLNPTNMTIPSRPAAGKIHGMDFKYSLASIVGNNVLVLRDSTVPARLLVLVLVFGQKPGEGLGGKKFQIGPNSEPVLRSVRIGWRDGREAKPELQSFTNGYAMKLEFRNVIKNSDTGTNMLAGSIFLCLPDTNYSYIAGTFNASFAPSPVRANLTPGQPVNTPPNQKKQSTRPGKRGKKRNQ